MTAGVVSPPLRAPHLLWRVGQWMGVLATVALVAGLVLRPGLTLDLLWSAVVPVLPAVFLVNAQLWRNVCPLATLTMLAGDARGTRRLPERAVRLGTMIGVALLVVLVPARHLLFNTSGMALAATIVAVGVVALAAGFAFVRKSGFCNAFCPVLPVERLYGQRPLLRVPNVRCTTCVQCTERGCLDRSHLDSIRVALGPRRTGPGWMLSPFGAFAGAFPGFIVAYYTTPNLPLAGAMTVYGRLVAAMVASLVLLFLTARLLRIGAHAGIALLAALAAGLYYWYAARAIAGTWQLGDLFTWSVRLGALVLIGGWLRRALHGPAHGGHPRALPVQ